MAVDTLRELQERKSELAIEIRKLADIQDKWEAEERSQWDTLNGEYDVVNDSIGQIQEREAVLARTAELEQVNEQHAAYRKTAIGEARADRQKLISPDQRAMAFQGWLRCVNGLEMKPNHRQACNDVGVELATKLDIKMRPYNRHNGWNMWDGYGGRPEWSEFDKWVGEQRDLETGADDEGGFLIPEGFSYELERTLLAFGGPRRVARIYSTPTGNPVMWPAVDDTGNTGELLAEEGDIGASVDPVFSQIAFGAYKFSSKMILVSSELMEDSAFSMTQLIGTLLGERIGRIQASMFTTGTGTAQPEGVVTASTLGKTAASATAITGDEIIELSDSLDPAYEAGMATGFMMSKATRTAVRLLKAAVDGDYLWQPGLRMGVPDMLVGKPITICQEMPAIEASAKPILYGDFSKFVIRDSASMRFFQLTELYRQTDQTGFIAFRRSDSRCLQAAAIKHLVMAGA